MNGERLNNSGGDNSSKWDDLRHDYAKEATRHAEVVSDIQQSFRRRLENIENENGKMSDKEFFKWEAEYAREFSQMEDETKAGSMNLDIAADNIERMVAFPGKGREEELACTVEAYSGNYYYERANELKQAITDNCQDKDLADQEIEQIKDFVHSAYDHIDFKFMDSEAVRDYGEMRYESDRTNSHNNVIKKLNGLNDLARKYHTTPFTARNFWPSDLKPLNRQTPAEATIMRYDRDIVEEYYAKAFPSAVQKAKAKQERDFGFGL